jgi:four helix bundle protein
MRVFERLEAWQRAHELTLAVYLATREWPASERYGLVSQACRSAVSVEANIAEGAARSGPSEFRRFLDISLGSLSELACLLRIATDLGLLRDPDSERLSAAHERASKVIWRLHDSMSRVRARE